jgi:Cd2+/Zn2+-exporting ATPase
MQKKSGKRLWLTVAAILFLAIGVALAMVGIGKNFNGILYGLALAIATAPVSWAAIKHFKENHFNADLLMSIAAVGAAAIGAWAEGAAVLILYNVAENIEDYTVDRVRTITEKTASLLPKRALVRKNGHLEEVQVQDLVVGEAIVVKPGWRIPVDGRILSGSASIDQSTITGESLPVEKAPGDEVLSGTLNLVGSLEIKVERPFEDSTMNRIVRLVMEARERKARIERFVDRFSRRYTPAMILLAISVALIPPIVLGASFSTWIYRALIVLIVACPSAFIIGTQVTMLIGLTRAMWSGVLVKGGIYLEELSRIRAVAFDKTGTLTSGILKVSEITSFDGFTKDEVLRVAGSAESLSSHPIGIAIGNEAKAQGLSTNDQAEVKEIAGKGVRATIKGGRTILVGRPPFLKENGIDIGSLLETGQPSDGSTVAVALDGKLVGLITVTDELRSSAKETIETLKALGMESVEMLTGDNDATAKNVAEHLGMTNYHAALLPEDKVQLTNRLKEKYGSVAMIGDGVNDAPVLAASSVGIAIGTAGNDMATEAADVALMGSDLRAVPYAIQLGRKVVGRLKINMIMALGFKFLVIVLGALGLIPLWFAVVGDDGITIVIIALTLPLLNFKGISASGRNPAPISNYSL